jgi:hypothetical protein
LLADSHNILNRWKKILSHLWNVHGVSEVRQIQIHASEPSVPDPRRFEVEIPIAKLKKYKSPGIGQILAELIQAGSETLWPEIHKVINSIWNKEEFLDQWNLQEGR